MQKTRLTLCALAVVATLGCADAGARLVGRLLESAPEPPRPAKVPASWGRYAVQPGDTLGGIAACHRVSVAVLARANRIAVPDRLPAHTVLRVPEGGNCASPRLARKAQPQRADAAVPGTAGAEALHEETRRLLAAATARYDDADFEQALSLARAGLEALAPHPEGAEADALRARCHVVAGMAAAGLERRERAIAEFRSALAFDPDVALEPERSSPRVLELVDAARASTAASDAPSEHFVESSER